MTTKSMRERFEAWAHMHFHPCSPERAIAWAAWQAATLAERERCAMMLERMNESDWSPNQCAEAIRKGEI